MVSTACLPEGVKCPAQDRRFAGITSECDESITRVAGSIDAHEFLVDPTAHVDGAACASSIRGMLNRAPRRRLSTGVRIITGRRHVESGVCLAECSRDAYKQCKQ